MKNINLFFFVVIFTILNLACNNSELKENTTKSFLSELSAQEIIILKTKIELHYLEEEIQVEEITEIKEHGKFYIVSYKTITGNNMDMAFNDLLNENGSLKSTFY